MHTRLPHTLALLGALSLAACGADPKGQGDDAGWCVDQERCGLGEDASVGEDAGEGVGVDVSLDVAPDAGVPADAGDPRPLQIDPPTDLGEVRDLAVHGDTACALSGARVRCWGYNGQGQAQPPEEDFWADRVVLTARYGCAIGPSSDLTCWGVGVSEIAAARDAQLISRYTIYGASGNSEVVCQSSDYVESTATITCYGAEGSWQVGPQGAIAIDVQYDRRLGGYPTVCYALGSAGRYAYQCMHGDAVIEVTSSEGDWADIRPTIKHDGAGQVAVLLADGDVAWYDLGLDGRAEPGARQATRLEVDWGTTRDGLDADGGARLLSPNCLYSGGVMLCRGSDRVEIVELARMPAAIVAAHELDDVVSYCYQPGDAAAADGAPECAKRRR